MARASWELESTARNLGLIRSVRTARAGDAGWVKILEDQLLDAAQRIAPAKQAT